MNYVAVNYVTTVLLKSKYLSKYIHQLKKCLFLIKTNLSQFIKINLNHNTVVILY